MKRLSLSRWVFVVSLPIMVSFSLLGGALSAHASMKGTNSQDSNSKTDHDDSDYSDSEDFEATSGMEGSAVSAILPNHLQPIDRTYHVDAFNRMIRQERLKIDSKLSTGKMSQERHGLESAVLQRGHELAGKIGGSPGRTLESHRNHTSEVNEAYKQFLQAKKAAWMQTAQAGGPKAAKLAGKIQQTEELQGALASYGESLANLGQSTNSHAEMLKTDLEVAYSYLNIADKFKSTVPASRLHQLGAAEGYYSDVKDYTDRLQAHHDAWEQKEKLVRQKATQAELKSADEAIDSTKAALDISFQSVQQSHKRLVSAVDYKFQSSGVSPGGSNETRVPSGSPVSGGGSETHVLLHLHSHGGGGGNGGGATGGPSSTDHSSSRDTSSSHSSNHQTTVTAPQKVDPAKGVLTQPKAQDAKTPEDELKRKKDLLDAARKMGEGVAGMAEAANKIPSSRDHARLPGSSKRSESPRKNNESKGGHSKGAKDSKDTKDARHSSHPSHHNKAHSDKPHGDKGHSANHGHGDSHADSHGEPHDGLSHHLEHPEHPHDHPHDHGGHHGNHHGDHHDKVDQNHDQAQKDSDKQWVEQRPAAKAEGKENDPLMGAAGKVANAVDKLARTENEAPKKETKKKLAEVEKVQPEKVDKQHLLGRSKGYSAKEPISSEPSALNPSVEKSEKKENAVLYLKKGDCFFRLEAKEISGSVSTLKKFYTDQGYQELSLADGEDDLNVLVANMHSVSEHVKNDTSGSSCDPDKARQIEGGSHSKVFKMEVLNQESARLLKASTTH